MNTRMTILAAACGLLTLAAAAAEPVPLFDGSDSYVDLGAPGALQIPSNEPFTVEGWMRFDSLSTRDMLYCKNNGRTGSPYTYMLGFADGKLAACNTTWQGNFAVSRQLDRWYHVAFSFDGTDMAFYLDGALLGTVAFSFSNTEAHTARIGGYLSTADIDGSISDVRVWGYARRQAEILQAMSNRLTGADSGLLGYWPLDEGSGTNVYDRTAAASDGILIGAVWTNNAALPERITGEVAFAFARPFTLADSQTGSTDFTNSNEVDVIDFPVPEGYAHYQITLGDEPSAINPNEWVSTNALPETVTFPRPLSDTNVMLYAWFTNSVSNLPPARAPGTIRYTEVPPVPVVRLSYSRERIPSQPVVIRPEEIDDGTSGGTTGGAGVPVHALSLTWLDGPDANATPEAPYVTVSELGTYAIELVVQNAAGTVATSAVCQVTVVAYSGDPFVWTGEADADWHNPLNWNLATVPVEGSAVIIGGGADVLLDRCAAPLDSLTLTGGTLTFSGWETRLAAETITLHAGVVTGAGPFSNDQMSNRVWLVCQDLNLHQGAGIVLDGKGYRGGNTGENGHGPGGGFAGSTGAGAGSHGGLGGLGYNSEGTLGVYGDLQGPLYAGSGGGGGGNGAGGDGGGAVRIEAAGAVTVDGTISANGTGLPASVRGGGSSGGSVWITCGTFAGSNGVIRANGGNALFWGGGGGGGRIAIIQTNTAAQAVLSPHRVVFSAHRGMSTQARTRDGKLGSLYLPDTRLIDGPFMPHTGVLSIPDWSVWVVDSLTVSGWLQISNAPPFFDLSVSHDVLITGAEAHWEMHWPRVTVGGNLTVTNGGRLTATCAPTNAAPGSPETGALIDVAGTLGIGGASWIVPQSEKLDGSSMLIRAGGVVIAEGGGINADERGFMYGLNLPGYQPHGYGPGHGYSATSSGSGAGYGGRGGRSRYTAERGETYGDPLFPAAPGSGGAAHTAAVGARGGSGGGLIRIEAGKEIRLDGILSANGQKGLRNGGGSGGGIFLRCRHFSGGIGAVLRANGGAGFNLVYDGGGGGGRIAVWTGESYAAGISPSRLVVSETPPAAFGGSAFVLNGASYASETEYSEPGTIRFVEVLPPQGTLLLLR